MHIASLNTRGINANLKRRYLFQTLNKFSISCLQETYITEATSSLWSKEWNGDFFHESGSSHSKGLIILVNRNFKVGNLNKIKINNRCLGISFSLMGKSYIIFNIYSPADKEERLPFLDNIPHLLKLNELPLDTSIIICGDFNTVANNKLDILTGAPHSIQETSSFNNLISTNNLTDCWRKLNPKSKDFSWIRYNSKSRNELNDLTTTCVARRLDYILCNSNLVNSLKSSSMAQFSSSDHKLVSAFFQLDTYPTGPGRWIFNDSLLDIDSFLEHMKHFIKKFAKKIKKSPLFDKRLSWDLLKIGIRDECISFSREKRINSNIDDIDIDLRQINKDLILNPDSETLILKLRNITLQKELLEISQAKGALKRSRAFFIHESERNKSFFLGLERSRQENMIIRSIYNANDELIEDPSKITENISAFYKKLLNSDTPILNIDSCIEELNTFNNNFVHPTLNNEEKLSLETPLDIKELDMAIKSLNRESSPGIDGLTPIFYLHFWDLLRQPLFDCFNEAIEYKSLSLSQRRAILTLLPKGTDTDLNDLYNWRPLSLTNTDYKIYSKILATRLQSVIKKIIHVNQVGYIPGRSISDHIRLIDDIINYSDSHQTPGILTSLDFKKAFDTVSKGSIIATMHKFGFGPNFIIYVETILSETEASVKNGGWLSHWFKTTRGVRQGCVLSPLLFIMVVEFLAIKIRSNVNIIGLLDSAFPSINEPLKLTQYADDVSLFLATHESLTEALNVIDDFKLLTGLTLNRKKSIAMCLGGLIIDNNKNDGLKWLTADENMKILGVFFNCKKEASLIKENWETKINDIKKMMTGWNRRNISLLGKCLVAKTFLLSKLNHIIQSLVLPDSVIDIIDSLIFQFLWMKTDLGKRATEKIKRTTLCLPVEQGGISMISIKDQQQVMLIKWLYRGSKKTCTHYTMINNHFKHLGGIEYILKCSAGTRCFKGLPQVTSVFWQKALIAWTKINKSSYSIDVLDMPIFNNSLLLYKGSPLLIQQWIKNDFRFYHQLIKENNQIKTYDEVCKEIKPYGGRFLDYLAAINAVRHFKTNQTRVSLVTVSKPVLKTIFEMDNKSLRLIFVKQSQTSPVLNCVGFWQRKINLDIVPYFKSAFYSTQETKLRLLHYKIVHNIYPCNVLLHKMKIKPSNTCDHCGEVDFIEHMFFTCSRLKDYWQYIEYILEEILEDSISLNITSALFGIVSKISSRNRQKLKHANHILLLAKFCIIKSMYVHTESLLYIFDYQLLLRKRYFPFLQ